jgi:hypothetical protein
VAIARVQLGTAITSTGLTTIAPAWPAATTVGNLLVAVICHSRPTTAPSLSIPGGSPWVLAAENAGTVAQECGTHIYYIANAASRSGAESSFTLSVARDMYGVLIEYSGVVTTTPLDVSTSKNGAGVTATALATNTTGTTAQAAELILGTIANANVDTSTADAMGGSATGGTFAKISEASSSNATVAQRLTARVYEQLVTAAGTAECHCTVASARLYSGTVVTFKASGAAPTVYPPKPLIVKTAVDRSFSY